MSHSSSTPRPSVPEREGKRTGFTLVELLIYVGVFSIAAGLFTGVLTTLTKVQVRESATVEVSQQAQFVIQTVQRLVTDASIIELASDTATSTLKLRMEDASRDPTCVQLSSGVVYLMEGNDGVNKQNCFATSSPQAKALTDSKVVVNTLNFTKRANPPAKDTVKIDLTVAYNSQNPQESLISRTLQTAITKISAATFDSDVIPSTDNFYTVGLGAQQWAKGFFSNLLVGGYSSVTGGVAAFNGNVGIGTASPATKLDVNGSVRLGTSATCDAATEGAQRYNSTSKAMEFCNGTAWGTVGGSGVPSGTIAFFAAACPTGWSEYTALQGRYVVGVPSGGTLSAAVGTALSNQENRPVGQHTHGITDPGHSHGSYQNDAGPYQNWSYAAQSTLSAKISPFPITWSDVTGITINNAGSVSGTNAPYLQLRACQAQ